MSSVQIPFPCSELSSDEAGAFSEKSVKDEHSASCPDNGISRGKRLASGSTMASPIASKPLTVLLDEALRSSLPKETVREFDDESLLSDTREELLSEESSDSNHLIKTSVSIFRGILLSRGLHSQEKFHENCKVLIKGLGSLLRKLTSNSSPSPISSSSPQRQDAYNRIPIADFTLSPPKPSQLSGPLSSKSASTIVFNKLSSRSGSHSVGGAFSFPSSPLLASKVAVASEPAPLSLKPVSVSLPLPQATQLYYHQNLSEHLFSLPHLQLTLTPQQLSTLPPLPLSPHRLPTDYRTVYLLSQGCLAIATVLGAVGMGEFKKRYEEYNLNKEKYFYEYSSSTLKAIKKEIIAPLATLNFDLEMHCQNLAFVVATLRLHSSLLEFVQVHTQNCRNEFSQFVEKVCQHEIALTNLLQAEFLSKFVSKVT